MNLVELQTAADVRGGAADAREQTDGAVVRRRGDGDERRRVIHRNHRGIGHDDAGAGIEIESKRFNVEGGVHHCEADLVGSEVGAV